MHICRRPILENSTSGGQKRFYAGMSVRAGLSLLLDNKFQTHPDQRLRTGKHEQTIIIIFDIMS